MVEQLKTKPLTKMESGIMILIGCERSGALRSRFLSAGYSAVSCDLEPAEDHSKYHIQADIIKVLTSHQWDLFICHPDCTALTVAGNHVYAAGKPKHWARLTAIEWTEKLWLLGKLYAKRVAFENPIGVLSTQSILGKASQYIQPHQFGEDASKATGLWLHNLPKLEHTERFQGRQIEWQGKTVERWSNQTDSGQNKLGPSEQRAMDRARTYPGIANAIVDQWGRLLK